MLGKFGNFMWIRRDGEKFSIGRETGVEDVGVVLNLRVGFRVPIKENLEQLALKAVANHPTEVAVRQNDGAYVLFGQPHHVAVKSGQVSAVVNHRHSIGGVDHEAHAVGNVFSDLNLGGTTFE